MKPFNFLSLAGAGLLTLLLAPMVLGNLHPWGYREMAAVQWLVFCPPRWLCLALALGAGLKTGRFGWVSNNVGARFLVVLGAHLGLGIASFFCLVEMSETHPPVPVWLRVLAVLISLVVPTVVIAFLSSSRHASSQGQAPSFAWRGLLVACVMIGGAAGLAVGWREHRATQEVQREEAARVAGRNAQERIILWQLDQLSPDAPLERWIPFTRMAGMPTVITRAWEAIRARPHLTQELTALLRGGDAPARALALEFVGSGSLSPAPGELIPSVCDALRATAASMRERIAAQPGLPANAFDEEGLHAAYMPDRFPGHAAEFVGPLREMRGALTRLPATAIPQAGQSALDAWLRQNDPNRPR